MFMISQVRPKDDTSGDKPLVFKRNRRRGTTLMEYLMMLSLIITVCLAAIGYLGSSNNTNMTNSSTAITKAVKRGS
jgi:uncharacterized protein (UPF0333 family)